METKTKVTGDRGEMIATDYLRRNGFLICARNWRRGRYEIDIVAQKWGVTHFVEVKTRAAGAMVSPEEAVTETKAGALRHAAEAYLAMTRTRGDVEFDLVAVDMFPDGTHEVRYVANAVEIGW